MLGYNPELFGGHSFRTGSASTAALHHFSEHEIKLLGRWESNTYAIYLRKPEVVAALAKKLI